MQHRYHHNISRETTSYGGGKAAPVIHRTSDVFVPPRLDNDPLDEMHDSRTALEQRAVRRKKRKIRRVRRRRRRRSAWQKRGIVIAVITILLLLWLFLRLAAVPFGSLIVEGNEKMSLEDVYRAGGIPAYVNVIQLSPQEIQDRLQKDLRIGDAAAVREFPAAIRITVTERKPAAIVMTLYGFAYIDKTGTVIDLEPQIEGVSVPLMTGKKVDTLLLGDTITDAALLSGLTYLQSLAPDVLNEIAEVNVGNPDNIIAYTSDSIAIYLGKGDEPAERAAITGELLQEVKGSHLLVQYIDTNINAPSVRRK